MMRDMLNSRDDELKSSKVDPIDGEEAFVRLVDALMRGRRMAAILRGRK